MKAIKYVSILAIAVMLASCEGATGPQGPQGPSGVSGLSTNGYTVGTGSWVSYSATQWYVNTGQNVSTSDVAVVYYSLGGSSYSPLPGNSVFYTGDILTFSYSNGGGVTLWYTNPVGNSPDALIYVNVADIPPSLQAKYPNIDWQNKSEAAGIPEVQTAMYNMGNK